jgi:hypothetical protein
MGRLKGIVVGLLMGICLLGGLFAAAAYYSPRFVNSPVLKRKIQDGFLEKLNLHVDYRQVDISLFPQPRLVIHQGVASMRQQSVAKFLTASIFPKIYPLLKGRFEFSKIDIDSPEIKIILSEKKDVKTLSPTEAIVDAWKELSPVMAFLAKSENDNLSLGFKNARMDLYRKDRVLISLWDLDWRLDVPGDKLNYRFSCRSNFWEDLFHEGFIDRNKRVADGEIRVKKLRIQPLQRLYFPTAPLKFGDSSIDLNLTFATDGREMLNADLKTSFSALSFTRGSDSIAMKGDHFDTRFSIDGSKIEISVASLNLDSPKINLAGKFFLDHAASDVRLELRGKGADVASVRKVILFIAQDEKDIKNTFDIIRAGRVNEILITSRAKMIQELGLLENIVIRGDLIDGNIFVPGPELDLTAVKGETVISKGILEGQNLSARLGNSRGHKGKLKIDLIDDNGPFLLDIMVDADISQLPPVLMRVVDDASFQKELKRIERVKGRALGRLVLGEKMSDIRPFIDVSRFNITADYQRVPYTLSVNGGRFLLKDTRIDVAGVDVSSKAGTVSDVNGSVDWGSASAVDVRAGESSLDLSVLYPWLKSMSVFKQRLAPCSSIKGGVRLTAAELNGDLFEPEKWDFRLTGSVEGLIADVRPVGDKVFIERGDFTADRKTVLFSETKMRLMDASLHLSGEIRDYVDRDHTRSIDLAGVLGARALKWVSALVKLPPEITIQPPLWISSAHLATEKGGRLSFSGKLAVQKGPSVDIDVTKSPAGLAIKHMRIKDDVSDATLKLSLGNRAWDASFEGLIEKPTLDAFLKENKVVTGWVAGDIQILIRPDNLIKSTAVGTLRGEGFLVFLPTTTIQVNRITLEATGNRLKIDAGQILWIDEKIDISGDMTVLDRSVKIDFDVSADEFDWNKYGNLITGRKSTGPKSRLPGNADPKKKALPLGGVIRFKTRHFRYGNYTWRPFTADLSIKPDYLMIDVHEANLCGISMPGMVSIYPDKLDLTIATVAKGESLDDTIYCLNKQEYAVEGRYFLDGYASMKGEPDSGILPGLKGEWQFTVKHGHINRLTILARIFELMNVANIFMLKLPDLQTEGFDYKQIDINWRLEDGKVYIDAGHLDSAAMEIAFRGTLDLINEQVDALVIVAPLQTMNLIIKNIPILRNILSGKFISIPFRVQGDIHDPSVIAMNPKDVGSEMLGVMKRTVKVPMQMIQPLTDLKKPKKEEQTPAEPAPAK